MSDEPAEDVAATATYPTQDWEAVAERAQHEAELWRRIAAAAVELLGLR